MQNVASYFDDCERGGGGFLHQKPPLPASKYPKAPMSAPTRAVLGLALFAMTVGGLMLHPSVASAMSFLR